MASFVKELSKLFSFRGAIKSNILSTSYSTIGVGGANSITGTGLSSNKNDTFNTFTSTRYLSQWYQKMVELLEYENSELSNIAVDVLKTYIKNYFSDSDDIVTLPVGTPDKEKYDKLVNKVLSQIKLKETTQVHLEEIIFFGSYSYKIDWSKPDRVWRKYELQNPYDVLQIYNGNELKFNLVHSLRNNLVQTAPMSIVTINSGVMHLINDIDPKLFEDSDVIYQGATEKDTIVRGYDILGGYPLYYNIMGKIKEYLLKDQLVSLLSIKDLIQPLLLLIRVDKSTDPTEANRLALNTEKLINKYSDLSAIFGSNFSIADLMDSILNNIRVLPDYNSAIGDMNSVDLSKISNKIQEIKSDLDSSKENIYTTLGIPRALFSGDTTKWEAIRSSQRLNNKIADIIDNINLSVARIASNVYYMLTKKEVDPNTISVNLFKTTDVDFTNTISTLEVVSQLTDSTTRLFESAQRFIQDSKLIDPNEYMVYIKDKLKIIDPNILKYVSDANIKKYIKEVQSQSDEGAFGRFR